jgi:uncharacterized protein
MSETKMIQHLFADVEAGGTERLQSSLRDDPSLSNVENEQGLTLLGYAAHFGNQEAVRLLLEHGADIHALSHSQLAFIPSNTALHAAIAGGAPAAVIDLLLERGANVNLADSSGNTTLHVACFDAHVDTVQKLLDHRADVLATNNDGQRPVHIALKQGHAELALLLEAAAKNVSS